jgi:hypothetical protein
LFINSQDGVCEANGVGRLNSLSLLEGASHLLLVLLVLQNQILSSFHFEQDVAWAYDPHGIISRKNKVSTRSLQKLARIEVHPYLCSKLNKLGGNSAITTNYSYIFDIRKPLQKKEPTLIAY